MIVVLADDLSGAVEMAGIGWRYGLGSEITVNSISETDKDLVVIDTDTRSVEVDVAKRKLRASLQKISKFNPSWIYKKTDSILRGHVVAELLICEELLNIEQILLVPENPSSGRTVENGRYYINGIPLEQTEFARDPEYPRSTSDVRAMIAEIPADEIHFVSAETAPSGPGVFFGYASDAEDMIGLAGFVKNKILPAGGSEFFAMVLQQKGYQIRTVPGYEYNPGKKRLFISGSASEQSRQNRSKLNDTRIAWCAAPKNLAENDHSIHAWHDSILTAFASTAYVAGFINQPVVINRDVAHKLVIQIARCVCSVLNSIHIDELIIEGGATASAIIRMMQWNTLMPLFEFETGVVALKIPDYQQLKLIIKPGGYPMPDRIWQS